MSRAGGSIALTTYQAGKVILAGWDGAQVTLLPRHFDRPMGLDPGGGRLLLATWRHVLVLANSPPLAHEFQEGQPGRYDALYLPRVAYQTEQLNIHDVAFGGDAIWLVNRRSRSSRPAEGALPHTSPTRKRGSSIIMGYGRGSHPSLARFGVALISRGIFVPPSGAAVSSEGRKPLDGWRDPRSVHNRLSPRRGRQSDSRHGDELPPPSGAEKNGRFFLGTTAF
jgi:hypothetical protein